MGGGIFKSPINITFYRLSKIHPYAGHLFLKFVFTIERIKRNLI